MSAGVKRGIDAAAVIVELCMGNPAKRERQERHTARGTATVGVDLAEARKRLAIPQRRSARLIDSILRDAGSADGPADLSSNLRRYLNEQ